MIALLLDRLVVRRMHPEPMHSPASQRARVSDEWIGQPQVFDPVGISALAGAITTLQRVFLLAEAGSTIRCHASKRERTQDFHLDSG